MLFYESFHFCPEPNKDDEFYEIINGKEVGGQHQNGNLTSESHFLKLHSAQEQWSIQASGAESPRCATSGRQPLSSSPRAVCQGRPRKGLISKEGLGLGRENCNKSKYGKLGTPDWWVSVTYRELC